MPRGSGAEGAGEGGQEGRTAGTLDRRTGQRNVIVETIPGPKLATDEPLGDR